MLLLLQIINSLVYNDKIINNVMFSFIAGCCIPIYLMTTLMLEGVGGDAERLTAFENDQNELSVILCIAVSFVFILLKRVNSKLLKLLLTVFVCLSLVSILLTGSRTGLVIFLVVALLGLLSLGKKESLLGLILALILIPVFLPYIPETNIDRMFETQDEIVSGNFTERGYIWKQGLAAFDLQPHIRQFIGVGYDQFPSLYKQTYGQLYAPHNTYLATYIEQGIIGCLVLMILLLFTFRKALRLCIDNWSFAYIGMIIPIVAAMITLGLQTRRWPWIIFLLIYILYKHSVTSNNRL
jgi:O-antigen ligase